MSQLNNFTCLIIISLLSISLFTGCNNEKKEDLSNDQESAESQLMKEAPTVVTDEARNLFELIKNDDLKTFEKHLTPENVNTINEFGDSLLFGAVILGNTDIVNSLISHGAEINLRNFKGSTALMSAIWGGHADIVNMLIDNGADLLARNDEGTTPLLAAAISGSVSLVERLLKSGAEIDERNNDGATALIVTSLSGHADIVKLLIDSKADINAADNDGITSLMLASFQGLSNGSEDAFK